MSTTVMILLTIIVLAAMLLPFFVHSIEKELEAFLFVLGIAAITVTDKWSFGLVAHAAYEPISISLAVLITGLLFRTFNKQIIKIIEFIEKKLSLKRAIIFIIFTLSLLSSIITAIIAALVLCEVASTLRLSKRDMVRVIVMGCFAIGMGAILTPIGEPLSTIVTAKLSGEPHHADFFFLVDLLWVYIIPGIILFSVLASRIQDPQNKKHTRFSHENTKQIIVRAGKIFLFVMALVFFGTGLTPLAEATILKLPSSALYWANSVSAILDNATVAAAAVVPSMSIEQIKTLLMSLVIAGGFLIPGNIPNIICASKFNIKSKEWAQVALPSGIVVMFAYFIVLTVLNFK